ncbi:FAD-dependent monooxygenase [Aquabacterium sp. OR-4]|uniref:FAD-dependent monooxygenase n=1 Tax=Aquabacterium sp. OR-4 TaxID=2978127 RepID=UPI0021B1FC70|nr:FAD-dependent monooxygenase [Aquabacterium sp. OR-4]MDT7834462.1 FAD-dependent monooxygenase [Aquabacterium sp. OR-4]
MTTLEVCIRGNGAVGLALALALARQGLRVGVVAPPADAAAAPARPDVRAYALNERSRRLLLLLKVWDALPPDAVTPVDDMRVQGDASGADGTPLGAIDFSAWQQGSEALAWIVDAAALEAALATAARFAPHLEFLAAPGDAALTVLAEGKASASRQALGVRFERHAYGMTALAARLVAGQPHQGVARQWFRSPDVLALLPFDRPQPGHSYGLVWSMPTAQAEHWLAAPPAAFEQALNEATGGAAGGLTLASERAAWPLQLGRAERLCGSGWVLVGDAAHVVHPLAGQGLNLGLADVAALAGVIAAREPWRALGDATLLRRYERARALPTAAMALVTDGLHHLFAQDQPVLRELRNRGMTLLNRLAPIKRLLTDQALDR